MPRYDRQLERNLVPMQHLGAAATASQRKVKYANAAECPGFQYDPVFGFQGLCGVCKHPKAKHPGDVAYKSPLARKKPRQNRMSVARRISMAARKNRAFHFSDDEMASDEEETGEAAARFSLPIVVVEEEVDPRNDGQLDRMSLRRSRTSKRAEVEIPAAAPLSARGRGYTEDGGEDDTIYDRLDTKFSDMYSTISKSSLPRDADFNTESDEHNSEEDVREDEEEEEEEVIVAAPPPPPILKKKNRVSNSMRESRRESCIRGSILREPVADAPRRVSRVTWLDETPAEIIQDVAADSDANTDDEEEALRAAAEQPASGKRMSAPASGIIAAVPIVADQDEDGDEEEEEEEMDGTKSVLSRLSRQSSASKRASRRSSSRRSARQEPLDDLDEASEEDDTDTMPKSSRLSAASKRSSRRSEQHDRDEEEAEDADDAALARKSVSRMSMRRSTASRSSRRSSKARDDDNDDNKRSSRRSSRSSRRSRKSSRRLAGDVDSETARLSAIREEEEEEEDSEEDSEEEEDASEEEDVVYGGAERSRSSKRSGRSSTRSSTRSSSSRDKDGKVADAGSASHKLLKSAAISTARSSGDSSGRSSLVTSVSRDQSRRAHTSLASRAASERDSGSEQEDADEEEEEEEEESSPREEEASEEEEDPDMYAGIEFDERDPSEDFENYFDWAGRPCRALYHDNEEFYPATILDYEGDKLFTVQFAKGTTQKETDLNDIQLVDRDNPLLAPIEAREDDIGFDSLADACRSKDATAVLAFLQRGEAPDEVDSNNETPLSIAAMLGDTKSAKILLQFGAMDMDGSALAKAANQDFRDFLITYGLGKAHPKAQCIQREGGDFDVLRKHLSAGASSKSRGRKTMRRLSPRGSSWPRIARTSHAASESSASSTSSTLKKMLCMNNGDQ
ncbi:Ankyrin repeat and SOCS box protein 8 [Hondaea fermentalgiana]|uniref:Ankyrin repeat and SOCS box protein 8 n=1 Tax=Hondaea fermentalgiana TaxID=2315210 RepID=A0A2R5GL05_9STRA|nr:Ankyrin repeat and SOCS box protein 8 [Hondaea fermentalgiana]|eukprot:GBG28554.1 Ankyrin repeat and SOCS box protein 8 [Hondaea fermentalgiana]